MKALADIIYITEKPDTKKYSEIPLAIKYGTEEQYQPIIDEVRNKLSQIYAATSETKDAFAICKRLAERSEKSLESLRSIKTMTQSEAEATIREINSILNSSNIELRENLVFKSGTEINKSIQMLMPDLLRNAFNLVVNAKSPKDIAELGKNPYSRYLINDTVSMAMSSLHLSNSVAKEGNVLSDNMKADDIKFAVYVIASLSSKINHEIIPSDKKIWILDSAEKELETLTNAEDNSLLSIELNHDDLSENYQLSISTMKDVVKYAKQVDSILNIAKLPHDMLYEGSNSISNVYEAASTVRAISHMAAGAENHAAFLMSVQSDIVDEFGCHDVYDLPSVFKVHDPQETDWISKYADKGTEVYAEVESKIKGAEDEQVNYEEELREISTYISKHLVDDLNSALSQVKKEKSLHLDAKAHNGYNM